MKGILLMLLQTSAGDQNIIQLILVFILNLKPEREPEFSNKFWPDFHFFIHLDFQTQPYEVYMNNIPILQMNQWTKREVSNLSKVICWQFEPRCATSGIHDMLSSLLVAKIRMTAYCFEH